MASNAAQPSQPERPVKALSVQPWHCCRIVDRAKCWELRGTTTKHGGRVALAAKGTGQLWGEATIVSSELVAHKDENGEFCPAPGNEAAFPGLADNYDKHAVRDLSMLPYPVLWAWRLEDALWYADPKPYVHPTGQMSWINLPAKTPESTQRQSTEPRPPPRKRPAAVRFGLPAKAEEKDSNKPAASRDGAVRLDLSDEEKPDIDANGMDVDN